MARRVTKNITPIGRTYTDLASGVSGFHVQEPKWYGDPEERIMPPQQVRLTEHEVGWVIRLGDTGLISLNSGDLTALGVALIRAGAHRS